MFYLVYNKSSVIGHLVLLSWGNKEFKNKVFITSKINKNSNRKERELSMFATNFLKNIVMKKYLRILSLVFVLNIYSCGDSANNCDGIECGPGTCEDGTCVCPDGFEGTACETNSNSAYFGNYGVVDPTCGTTNNTTNIESISIAAHPNGIPTEIELSASSSSTTATMDGTLVNGNIEAEGPFSTFTLEISGTFSDNDNFEATLTGAGLVCRDVTYAK